MTPVTWLRLASLIFFLGFLPAGAATLSEPTLYYGMCDASAAVALGTNLFAVANDEDNILRVYRRQPGGLPVTSFDVTPFLRLTGKSLETDLEGAARVGDRIYWITSHGRNAKGKYSPNRQRFFATTIQMTNEVVTFQPVGRPYTGLLRDFLLGSRLGSFRLGLASRLAPKAPGGLNIEGLTATREGHLLLGFRNPIPRGLALIVPLLNPAELIEGRLAKFGNPILLDLGGLGVRSMGWGDGRFLIIAGHYDNDGVSRLYEWAGPGATPKIIDGVNFAGSNPEGIAFENEGTRTEFFVLSDDGTLKIKGIDCKRFPDPSQRRFRGYLLDLP
jgi:hypothetical protein